MRRRQGFSLDEQLVPLIERWGGDAEEDGEHLEVGVAPCLVILGRTRPGLFLRKRRRRSGVKVEQSVGSLGSTTINGIVCVLGSSGAKDSIWQMSSVFLMFAEFAIPVSGVTVGHGTCRRTQTVEVVVLAICGHLAGA